MGKSLGVLMDTLYETQIEPELGIVREEPRMTQVKVPHPQDTGLDLNRDPNPVGHLRVAISESRNAIHGVRGKEAKNVTTRQLIKEAVDKLVLAEKLLDA